MHVWEDYSGLEISSKTLVQRAQGSGVGSPAGRWGVKHTGKLTDPDPECCLFSTTLKKILF